MKTIQNPSFNEELKRVIEKIVLDLGNFLPGEKLSFQRVLPPAGTPIHTPAGYPHWVIQTEKQKKFLGLIPYTKNTIICVIKEGFYDVHEKGEKAIMVLLPFQDAESIVNKHLEEYGNQHQATEIVYKT